MTSGVVCCGNSVAPLPSPPLPFSLLLFTRSLSLILFLFFFALSRSPAASSAVFIRLKAIYSETFARKMQTLPASLCPHPSLAYTHTHTQLYTHVQQMAAHMFPKRRANVATSKCCLGRRLLLSLPLSLPPSCSVSLLLTLSLPLPPLSHLASLAFLFSGIQQICGFGL